MQFSLQAFSFIIGFITATIFWWLMGHMRPLWGEIRENWRTSREEAKARRSTGVEENHRRTTLRRAQGMHLAAPLFALDEIIETPRLLAPPMRVEPGTPPITEDIVARTVPYMPSWPELAAVYHAPTLGLGEALSGGINLVITGQPGTGKTVALAHLASLVANRDPDLGELSETIPFLYHIADLRLPQGETKDILNPILDAASEHAPVLDLTRLPNFVEFAFSNGQALLLLDGFDELSPNEQVKVSSYLKALLNAYPKIQIVTTGCPEHLDGLIGLGFEPMVLMPWTAKQQDGFIEKWGQHWNQTVAAESWSQEATDQPEQIDSLLINSWLSTGNNTLTPFELTLKVWAAYAGDSLGPNTLDSIATHIRRLAPKGTPLAALETLGMQVALSSQAIFDSHSAREWVKNFELPEEETAEGANGEENLEIETGDAEKPKTGPLKQKGKTGPLRKTGPLGNTGPLGKSGPVPATSSLLNKMTDSGLLVSHPDNHMRFLHPVFGGYLAGRALAAVNVDISLLQQPDWTGKLLAMRYLAAHGDATGLANAILKQTEMPLHSSLFNAARWLRDAPREAPWRGKVFSQLANLLQTDGIPLTLRAQAVAAFYWSGDPGAAPLFRQFMKTPSFELVQLAALGSGAVRDPKAVDLLSSVLHAPSLAAQRAGCLALVAIGSGPAMEFVAHALLEGEEDLRRAAAEALANDPSEGYAMLKEGITLEDILLRRAVVYGLARVEDDWAIEALENIRVEDDQWVVRNSASEVLDSKNQTDPRVPRRLTTPSETPWLIEFAGKQGVGISPGSPATEILVTALKSDNNEERLAALPYLKHMPNEGVITSMYHAMYRDDPELREAVFLVLCELAAGGVKLPDPVQFGLG
jgi:HEAT repeat protein